MTPWQTLKKFFQKYWGYVLALAIEVVGGGIFLHHSLGIFGDAWYLRMGVLLAGGIITLHYVHLTLEHHGFMPTDLRHIIKDLREKKGETLSWSELRLLISILLRHAETDQMQWPAIQQCMEALFKKRGVFPSTVIDQFGGRLTLQNTSRACEWLNVFLDDRLSPTLKEEIHRSLMILQVPRQVEGIFSSGLENLVRRMAVLADEKPIPKVDRTTQYLYASGVAQFYNSTKKSLDDPFTVYATALDKPSMFWADHSHYFDEQVHLPHFSDARFITYATIECTNVWAVIDQAERTINPNLPETHTGVPIRSSNKPPTKSRLVLIKKQELIDELGKPAFWSFVTWHANHHFGLKFLLIDSHREDDWYANNLSLATGQDKDATIDDFIVYGDECVYGRVNPVPDVEGKVTVGFLYRETEQKESSTIAKYRAFFDYLWRDGHSLTVSELWFVLKARMESQDTIHNLRGLFETYQIVLQQRSTY